MLKFSSTENNPLEIQIEVRRPSVYLDCCIISNLTFSPQGELLRRLICDRGTLHISWAHIIELFARGSGRKFDAFSEYLISFGPHFVVLDSNVKKVMDRERDWVPGKQSPGLDEDCIRLLGTHWDGKSPMSLDLCWRVFRAEEGFVDGMRQIQQNYNSTIRDFVEQQRQRYWDQTDKSFKNELDTKDYSGIPSHWSLNRIGLELVRETIRTNEQFNPSDAFDISHAAVSVAYCDFTVLDKKWARRCRSLPFPAGSAAIYDGTEIDRLLRDLSTSWSG